MHKNQLKKHEFYDMKNLQYISYKKYKSSFIYFYRAIVPKHVSLEFR